MDKADILLSRRKYNLMLKAVGDLQQTLHTNMKLCLVITNTIPVIKPNGVSEIHGCILKSIHSETVADTCDDCLVIRDCPYEKKKYRLRSV